MSGGGGTIVTNGTIGSRFSEGALTQASRDVFAGSHNEATWWAMGTFDRAGCRGEAVAANSGVNLGKLICQVIGPCRLSSPGAGLKGGPSHCVCQPSTGCRRSKLNLFIKT